MRPVRELHRNRRSAYFVSTQTARRQPFFRHERWAVLLRDTIYEYCDREYTVHAFVIMPDHLHLLIVPENSLEKAVQMIKGRFSFRARRQFNGEFDVWQQGFSDHRIRDVADWNNHLEYIRRNPIEAGLAQDCQSYPYMEFPNPDFPQGLKPQCRVEVGDDVRAKARTLPAKAHILPAQAGTLRDEAENLRDEAGTVRARAAIVQAEPQTEDSIHFWTAREVY
jgi:putative transposase